MPRRPGTYPGTYRCPYRRSRGFAASWTRPMLASIVALLAVGTACAPRAIRGGPGTENPSIDEPAMSTGLDRADIDYLVDQNLDAMVRSAFWRRDIEGSPERPLVAIWPIMNATTHHLGDQTQTILSSIETALVNSGEVRVVARERQEELAREIGIQQGAIFDPASAQRLGRQLGAEYFMTGKITAVDERLQKTRRVQYSLFMQVLRIETGEVMFQNESTRTKALKR